MRSYSVISIYMIWVMLDNIYTLDDICCEPDSSGNSSGSSEESTFFEILDDVIYKSLSDPQPGCSEKLLADINMFQDFLVKGILSTEIECGKIESFTECLARVKRMYTEMEGGKIEALRNSIVRLYATRGGPTFTRFPINKAKNKRRLLERFDWSEENISNLNELLEQLENVWYALRHIVI